MTTQSLDLNLIPKGISPRLYVSQYDKGQTWTFNIYAGNTAYTIPNGATVTIQGTKPDKTGFQYSCTASGNVVTATEQQQMTVIAGEVSAEIRITNNNEIIATLNFILVVEPAALTDETEISETDLPIIEQAIEMFPHYQEMIDDVSSDIATLSNVRAKLGAHNLFPITVETQTNNGVTCTITRDAKGRVVSVKINGTASPNHASFNLCPISGNENNVSSGRRSEFYLPVGSYILSGGNNGDTTGNGLIYNNLNGVSGWVPASPSVAFEVTDSSEPITIGIRVAQGNTATNKMYYPMIRLATDTSTEYEPFSKPNTELTKDDSGLTANAFANGAVNLLPCDATSNVQTGLTYIVEDDGTVKVSGTNTSNETAQIAVTMSYVNWDSTKRYRISGCPSNGSSNSYRLGLTINKSDGWSRTLTELGDGLEFQLASNETKIKVSINISAGYAISGTLVFKPMVTVADMPNSDYAHYVPYAKSNKELTRLIKKKTATVTTSGSGNASIATDLVPYSAQILAINVTSGAANGAIAVAYKNLGASVNGLHVVAPDGTSLASTQIGIEVIYIDGADVT